jgi:small GTP-binding protein
MHHLLSLFERNRNPPHAPAQVAPQPPKPLRQFAFIGTRNAGQTTLINSLSKPSEDYSQSRPLKTISLNMQQGFTNEHTLNFWDIPGDNLHIASRILNAAFDGIFFTVSSHNLPLALPFVQSQIEAWLSPINTSKLKDVPKILVITKCDTVREYGLKSYEKFVNDRGFQQLIETSHDNTLSMRQVIDTLAKQKRD